MFFMACRSTNSRATVSNRSRLLANFFACGVLRVCFRGLLFGRRIPAFRGGPEGLAADVAGGLKGDRRKRTQGQLARPAGVPVADGEDLPRTAGHKVQPDQQAVGNFPGERGLGVLDPLGREGFCHNQSAAGVTAG